MSEKPKTAVFKGGGGESKNYGLHLVCLLGSERASRHHTTGRLYLDISAVFHHSFLHAPGYYSLSIHEYMYTHAYIKHALRCAVLV